MSKLIDEARQQIVDAFGYAVVHCDLLPKIDAALATLVEAAEVGEAVLALRELSIDFFEWENSNEDSVCVTIRTNDFIGRRAFWGATRLDALRKAKQFKEQTDVKTD